MDGEERFWTVSGDNVGAVCFIDFNKDKIPEMVAGSDDFEIRVFQGEELIHEIKEKAKVTKLTAIAAD